MAATTYHDLALEWNPRPAGDARFNLLAVSILVVALIIGYIFSTIKIPVESRAINAVPDRIAQFVLEKEKPKPVVKVEPELPKPILIPSIRKIPDRVESKPLTKVQEKAREKAADSGLLALGNEMADLMDTSAVASMVTGKVSNASPATKQASSINKQILMADAGAGGVHIDGSKYTAIASSTNLKAREITKVGEPLLTGDAKKSAQASSGSGGKSSGGVRADEDVTIVFDLNKSKLYSLYNRARRNNPGLKGKIVLEIIIEPTGQVSNVRIISSELNDKDLEAGLIARIKQFDFGVRGTKAFTVTYPIEFLPS